MSKNPFLKRAYRLKNQQDTLSMYGDWAAYGQAGHDIKNHGFAKIMMHKKRICHRLSGTNLVWHLPCGGSNRGKFTGLI